MLSFTIDFVDCLFGSKGEFVLEGHHFYTSLLLHSKIQFKVGTPIKTRFFASFLDKQISSIRTRIDSDASWEAFLKDNISKSTSFHLLYSAQDKTPSQRSKPDPSVFTSMFQRLGVIIDDHFPLIPEKLRPTRSVATAVKTRDENKCLSCKTFFRDPRDLQEAHIFDAFTNDFKGWLPFGALTSINQSRNIISLCPSCHTHFDNRRFIFLEFKTDATHLFFHGLSLSSDTNIIELMKEYVIRFPLNEAPTNDIYH